MNNEKGGKRGTPPESKEKKKKTHETHPRAKRKRGIIRKIRKR